jgi:hypothetical protein
VPDYVNYPGVASADRRARCEHYGALDGTPRWDSDHLADLLGLLEVEGDLT